MKTAMQILITELEKIKDYHPTFLLAISTANDLLEKEKEQLKKADINGANRVIYNSNEYGSNKLSLTFEEYYNQTYNQNK